MRQDEEKWCAWRKVEFYPFDITIVNEGYARHKSSATEWRFKSLLFYFHDGYVDCLRDKVDLEQVKRYLQQHLDEDFAKRIGREMRDAAEALLAATKKAFEDRISLKKGFRHFMKEFVRMLSVLQFPDYAQNLGVEKDKKLLTQFGMQRDYAAQLLAEAEHMYRQRLGEILELPREQALMLLPFEVEIALEQGTFPKDLHQRKTFLLLTERGTPSYHWNREADALFLEEYGKHRIGEEQELKGQCAFPGTVQGKAYVALNEDDFKKIPEGSILVCSMTRYTIVPYLKKVKAIVTDQGGITCHAAVICRELKVPTLISTKKATDVFKTGDMVEVDAEKGIVKKL